MAGPAAVRVPAGPSAPGAAPVPKQGIRELETPYGVATVRDCRNPLGGVLAMAVFPPRTVRWRKYTPVTAVLAREGNQEQARWLFPRACPLPRRQQAQILRWLAARAELAAYVAPLPVEQLRELRLEEARRRVPEALHRLAAAGLTEEVVAAAAVESLARVRAGRSFSTQYLRD